MSKIIPIGYSENKMGRGMGIFFLIFAVILSAILVSSGMEIKYTVYLFVVAIILAILFVLTDLYSNKKNKTKIEHMEKMLKCPYVISSVIEVKKYYRGLGGELKDIKPGFYVKSKDCAYTIVASFKNSDNNEVLVESEPYAQNPIRFRESDKVRIHYSADNEYWIDVSE